MIDEPISHTIHYNPTQFAAYSRPQLVELLEAIGLDIVYERAKGDYLYYRQADGSEVEVLDMLGGFGAGLFGHNHPELVRTAQRILTQQRPFLAQGSVRAATGELAAQLSQMVGETTGKSYVTTLANSGTEAVEAGLKHAALQKMEAAKRLLKANANGFRQLRMGLKLGTHQIPADLFTETEALLDVGQVNNLEQLEFLLTQHNQAIVFAQPSFVALKGAFHGKTTGSVQLTYNKDFRLPWQNLGVRGLFTPINDRSSLAKTVAGEREQTLHLVIEHDHVWLEERPWSRIAAILIEPIQGEGGIHPVTVDFLHTLRETADAEQVPLIIDEIQSGMGRTGVFLASADIRGDIYIFSKSLGGSLAKIGAMLVEKEQYLKPFGYLHSSTFADDAFSSEIALTALRLLRQDEGALIERCGAMGGYLINRLKHVQASHPSVIKAIRGRGLMVGIELTHLNRQNRSPLLNIASEQNLLGFLLSGYLLHEHQMRVTPTVSATNTIRVEPSAYITHSEIDRFFAALVDGVSLIEAGNGGDFLRYLTHSSAPAGEPAILSNQEMPSGLRRVAIVSHFIEPEQVTDFDPSLGDLTADQCSRLLEKTQSVLDPFLVEERVVWSQQGDGVILTVLGIPYTAEQIDGRMKMGKTEPVIKAIEQTVEMAKELGCLQIGLTGYCSIVTQNCTALVEDRIGLTSGNSLTAAAATEGLHQLLQQEGISKQDTTLGLVGGIGNIGRVLALAEHEHVGKMVLVGRRGRRRLEKLADEIYTLAWQQIRSGEPLKGIAKTLVEHPDFDPQIPPSTQSIGQQLGDEAPIKISLELADLKACNAILTATNAPQPIITAEHIADDRPVVLCDVAIPNDVDPDLAQMRPNVRVIKGGILQLPNRQALDIPGVMLPAGQAYACVAETLLLGLAGINEPFSYGPLRPERVRQASQMAKQFGFEIVAKEGLHNKW